MPNGMLKDPPNVYGWMPEVSFKLEWPDGQSSTLYSPSTVILEYLKPGDSMRVSELESLGVTALRAASERVRARYGFACTRTDEERNPSCGNGLPATSPSRACGWSANCPDPVMHPPIFSPNLLLP